MTSLTTQYLYDKIIEVAFYHFESVQESDSPTASQADSTVQPTLVSKEQYQNMGKEVTLANGTKVMTFPKILSKNGNMYTLKYADADTKVEYLQEEVATLKCPNGLKPDIDISFSLLPGRMVYDVLLHIKNLHLKYDIRTYNKLEVKCGYKDESLQRVLNVSVWSSYQETPNPDGITTFRGILVDSYDIFFTGQTRKLKFYGSRKKPITLQQVIETCSQALSGVSMTRVTGALGEKYSQSGILISGFSDEMLESSLISSKVVWICENGYALLRKLSSLLKSWDPKIHVAVYDNAIVIFTDMMVDTLTATKPIIKLRNIKVAQFTGPALTVKAPWIPSLQPGDLFEMNPNFINGAQLPNLLPTTTYVSKENMYRIITMSVQFATTAATNEMTILALPVNREDAGETVKEDMNAQKLWETINAMAEKEYQVGELEVEQGEETEESEESESTTETVDDIKSFAQQYGAQLQGTDYIVVKFDELHVIATHFWDDITIEIKNSELNGKELYGNYTKPPKYAGWNLWPMIVVATQYAMNNDTGNVGYKILYDDPDNIAVGWVLRIPNISDWKSCATYKDIFKVYRKYYMDKNQLQYAETMGNIYIYLGGEKE